MKIINVAQTHYMWYMIHPNKLLNLQKYSKVSISSKVMSFYGTFGFKFFLVTLEYKTLLEPCNKIHSLVRNFGWVGNTGYRLAQLRNRVEQVRACLVLSVLLFFLSSSIAEFE